MIMAEFENPNFDSLLEDPVESEVVEEQVVEEEPLIPNQPSDTIESTTTESNDAITDTTEDDLITSYLKTKGIADPKKIQFENDEGGIDEVDFATLPKEEQLTMLQELASSDFTDYERSVVNYLRQNNTDLQGVINYFSQKAVEDYLAQNPNAVPQKTYTIDDYSDDELYIADLAAKFPDFTEDELNEKLNSAKANEELFKKEVDSLREFYKGEEDRQAEDTRLREQQQYEALQNSLLDAANRFNEISLDSTDPESESFEVEESDKQIMLDYLLNQDKDGYSQLSRDLSDPAALMELAWFRTHGRDAIDEISRYWKGKLAETRKELTKAKKDLEKYTKKKDDNSYVATTKQTPTNQKKTIFDVWDI